MLLLLFKAEHVIDALDEEQNQRLPRDQISQPVEQLAVQQVRLLPRIPEQLLEVDFLLAVRARLLLADNQPAAYTKPAKLI